MEKCDENYLQQTKQPRNVISDVKEKYWKIHTHLKKIMSQQGIDAECACSDCLVKSPNEVIIGTGTVLCKEGYEAGIHYWDFLAKQCGWHSFCGVSARDPGDEHETRHGRK